jgi:hypothetical protein
MPFHDNESKRVGKAYVFLKFRYTAECNPTVHQTSQNIENYILASLCCRRLYQ